MTTSAQEAIAVLIDLAQQGAINPWDVQVIEIVDRFLDELGLMGTATHECEADLPKSGQAFLWASMLVLLKAKTLERLEDESEEAIESEPTEEELSQPTWTYLERHLRRRTSAPPPRKRRVTLEELIEQIQQIATEVEAAPSPIPKPPRHSRREAIRTIAKLAHHENLTEIAFQLDQFLHSDFSQLAGERASVELEELVNWWSPAVEEPFASPATHDRIGVFWALLLLSAQSKVELEQSEFYQDLKIRPIGGQTEERSVKLDRS